jgi:pimeloyl-ACP methyl ester carboxylesterase
MYVNHRTPDNTLRSWLALGMVGAVPAGWVANVALYYRMPASLFAKGLDPVLETSLFLKRCLPASGLLLMPKAGHAVNLEEPAAFNRAIDDFFAAVERGAWAARDARTQAGRSAMLPDQHTTADSGH